MYYLNQGWNSADCPVELLRRGGFDCAPVQDVGLHDMFILILNFSRPIVRKHTFELSDSVSGYRKSKDG